MRHVSCKIVFLVTAITATVIPVASQTPPAQKPSFEVATVKPANGGRSVLNAPPSSGSFQASGFPLKWFVCYAYRLCSDQVVGGPAWVNTDLWEIQAKAGEGSVSQQFVTGDNSKPDTIALMLQSFLEERFRLKLHRETRESPVYILTVGTGAPNFKVSEDRGEPNVAPSQNAPTGVPQPGLQSQPGQQPAMIQTPYGPIANPRLVQPQGMIRRVGDDLTARGVGMSSLANFLSQWLGRPVLDKTGLEGLFDFKLHWTPPRFAGTPPGVLGPAGPEVSLQLASEPSAPSIFTAIQELGLKLEPAKAPLEVLVIDSVQKPVN